MQLSPYLNIATRAIFSAGKILVCSLNSLGPLASRKKYQISLIDKAKLECEQEIAQILLEAFPEHAILGKEIGEDGISDSDYLWLVKSLDGTTNFVRTLPLFTMSVALQHRGEALVGVIYDPVRNEMFTATKGGGAWIDKHRIRTGERTDLSEAIFGIGLAWQESPDKRHEHQAKRLMARLAETRKSGCNSLDLAYVAAGRLDGWWSCGLEAWDMAAGALLVAEAGGVVSDLAGESDHHENGNMLATTIPLREKVLALYKEAARESLEPSAETPEEETLEGAPEPVGEHFVPEYSDRGRPEERTDRRSDWSHSRRQNESGNTRRSPRPFAEKPGWKPRGRAPGPPGERFSPEYSDRGRPEERTDRRSDWSHSRRQNESGNTRRSPRPFAEKPGWKPHGRAPGPPGERFSPEYSDRGRPEERTDRRSDWSHSRRQNESGNTRRSPRPFAEKPGWKPRGRAPGPGGERFSPEYSDRGRPERRTDGSSDWSHSRRQNESGNTRRGPRPFAEKPGWKPRGRAPGPAGERFAPEYSDRGRPERRTDGSSDRSHSRRQNESGNFRRNPRSFAEKPGWKPRGRAPGPAGERFAPEYSDRGRPGERFAPEYSDRGRPERRTDGSSDWSHSRRQNESGNFRKSPQPFARKPGWEAPRKTPKPADEQPVAKHSDHTQPEKKAKETSDLPHTKKRNETEYGNEKREQRKQQDGLKQEHPNHPAVSPESAGKTPHGHTAQHTENHGNTDKSILKETPDSKNPVT